MTAPKRDFGSFAHDYYDSSTPLLSGFSSLPPAVEESEIDVQWPLDTVSFLESPDDNFYFPGFAETTHPSSDEQYFGQNGNGSIPESYQLDDPGLEPVTQSSDSTAMSHDPQGQSMNICYGMIYLSKAKLMGSMVDVMDELKNLKEDVVKSHYLLDVVLRNQELFVALPSGLRTAQLNQQIREALHDPMLRGEVRLQVLIHKETILNAGMFESIGGCLSKHKIWLQRPDWRPSGSTYKNPHVIHFESVESSDAEIATYPADAPLHELSNDPIEDIYSKLSRATRLKGVAGDSRLATQLLPHQEEALDFMVQREQGNIPDEFKLWIEDTVNDVIQYRHKITGHRARAAPNEHGGGILADDMGTGKTLSALALIVATLGSAEIWSRDQEVHLSENIPAFKTLSRATLVVVPSPLLLGTWRKEIRKHMKTDLNVFVYHGMERKVDRAHLAEHDIVLTTYHTLVADHAKDADRITQIAWYRIVLDEAHCIRRTSTLLHKRVAELDAKFRWCLTGTPIQNSLDDLGALFAFLSIAPFDRLGYYKKYISTKYAEGSHGIASAQDNLVRLLDAMCIRRTKDEMNLCPVEETSRFIDFSREERIQYNSMTADMKRAMENIIGESDSRRRFGAFQAKLQLRLLCNHGTYEDHFHWAKHGNLLDGYVEGFDGVVAEGSTACSICGSFDLMSLSGEDLMDMNSCVHVLCTTCKTKSSGQCPLCDYSTKRRDVADAHTVPRSWTSKSLRRDGYSSKMEALVQDLLGCREDKSIVFSCWTTTLELVARHLRRSGIRFEQIDGRMPLASRQRILEAFSTDGRIAVLIMTTGVGAFGLDLITANRVFLVEPQWNPSVESQAVGRTIRIGQQKTVQVTRYIMRDTVEEDFQELQRRKRGIARMAERNPHDGMVKAEFGDSIAY